MGINIETYTKLLTHLDVEQLYFVRPEHIETAATRILIMSLDDVILSLPCCACSCRNALPRGNDSYDFTFYFHNYLLVLFPFLIAKLVKYL